MDEHSYDDIINLPNPTSKNHPRMSLHDRAAQFAPFAALTGHDAAIKETARLTDERLELFERAKQHLKSIENRTNISSLNNAMDDDDLRIEIRLIESVEYKFDNYYKDAQRLASRENHWIDEYQEKNQCLEQVPEGKRPSIESWERQKEKYKNRSNKS